MGQLAHAPSKMAQVDELLRRKQRLLKRIVPQGVDVRRLIASYYACAQQNPRLVECTPDSQLRTVLHAAQIGLELGGPLGEAYPVPYKNRGQYEAQLQVGYRGLVKLAKASGSVISIFATVVYEDDTFEWEQGTNAYLKHYSPKDAVRDDDHIIAAYAVITYTTGAKNFAVMWRDELEAARSRSPAWRFQKANSPWGQFFAEMCRKTVTRWLLKYEQLSPALARAVGLDEAAETGVEQDHIEEEPSLDDVEGVADLIELRKAKNPPKEQLDAIAKKVLGDNAAWPPAELERQALTQLTADKREELRKELAGL